MTCKYFLREVVGAMQALATQVDLDLFIKGVSTDSRKVQPGELFVALQGENFDGHQFVNVAIAEGAVAAVVNQACLNTISNAANLPLLAVTDTLRAYQDLANWWRNQCNLPVIAVTGSAGKTTTKEMISTMLGHYPQIGKQVHKSLANHNNDIGVAETLLAIDPDQHDYVVVEMGMRGAGEILRLAKVAAPTVGVITNIGTAHIGRLGSQAAIASAKCELLEQLQPQGIAVLNAEDELLQLAASQVWQGKTITYGIGKGDINGEFVGNELRVGNYVWQLPLPGRHNALNFLAGLAVLKALNLDWQGIAQGIGDLKLPAGRAQVHQLPEDVIILDETYNASPEATIAALHLLAAQPARKRWAVLGTMKELGAMSEELHKRVGNTVKQLGIDGVLVLTDGESDAILQGAGQELSFSQGFNSFASLNQALVRIVKPGDRILFKASRSVGMDKAVCDFQTTWCGSPKGEINS